MIGLPGGRPGGVAAFAAGLLLGSCLLCRGAGAQGRPGGDDDRVIGDPPSAPASANALNAQPANVQDLFRLTNQDRAAQGLPALGWDPSLARAAQAHAARMAEAASSELSHRYPGEQDLATRAAQAGAHFASIAENIAQGGTAKQIATAWMRSTPHRTNILDPRMNSIGVAVFASGGTLYAAEDFSDARVALPPEAVEQRVEAELGALASPKGGGEPLVIDAAHKDAARRICQVGDASGIGQAPWWPAPFTAVWQGSDLALPPALTDAVRRGQYRSAVVGACVGSGGAFTTYRVAVVLD